MRTLVMKFGGAAVATPEQFAKIADLIQVRSQEYDRLITVVSAMGDTTDELITLAKRVNPDPPRREYDMLVTVGERISISLLAMALARIGCQAVSFTGSQSGIITCPEHTEAQIIEVRPHRIVKSLEDQKIVIVAGFQGVSQFGEITTLGRGGSDTTAVALAVAMGAEKVEFYKDVAGIFAEDPKVNPNTEIFHDLDYETALSITMNGAQVLHARCIELARHNGIPLHVRSFERVDEENGTLIADSSVERPEKPIFEVDSAELCPVSR